MGIEPFASSAKKAVNFSSGVSSKYTMTVGRLTPAGPGTEVLICLILPRLSKLLNVAVAVRLSVRVPAGELVGSPASERVSKRLE